VQTKAHTQAKSATAGDGDGDGGWLADLRGGLATVLRAKAPREMRHAALDLCAAAADLAGAQWLCGNDLGQAAGIGTEAGQTGARSEKGVKGGNAKAGGGSGAPPPSFFRLVLELTRVEAAVLLHDLTRDDVELRAQARKFLPVPLVAYERLVAALAADSAAAEEQEERDEARRQEGAGTGGVGGGGGGGGGEDGDVDGSGVSLLSAEVAQLAVRTLADVAGSLLEFLEDASERSQSADHYCTDDDTAAKPGEGGAADPAVVLAVVRALGAFLTELPDAHSSRVNALLPALLAAPTTTGKQPGAEIAMAGTGGGVHSRPVALVPSPAMRALVIRFTLPYLLQATEAPPGLDAYAAADGPGAMAFLMERVVGMSPAEGGEEEARGVLAAACATLRNAMEGAARGHVGDELADAAAAAFARVLPSLSRWAATRVSPSPSASSGPVAGRAAGAEGMDHDLSRDREDVSFLRSLATAGDPSAMLARGGWRGVHEFLEALVPSGTDPGEMAGAVAYTTGGGTSWVDDDEGLD